MREIESIEEFDNLLRATAANNQVLVVDFFATWCGPCMMIAPHYEALSHKFYNSDVIFVKVNADSGEEISEREMVSALPTFKIFKNGICLHTIAGAQIDAVKEAVLDAYYDDSVKEFLSGGWDSSKRIARSKLLNVITQAVIKLADNKPFALKLSDPDFENYFLITPGCMQILFNVGFQEETDSLVLPATADRRGIDRLIRQLRGPPPLPVKTDRYPFLSQLENYRRRVALCANPDYQKKALKDIPLDKLIQEAAETNNISPESVKPYQLLRALLRWFNEEFFEWFDNCVCDECGSTMKVQSVAPTATEWTEGMAYTVEVYSCPTSASHSQHRFPRFNHPLKLMQTRKGRCGEWATCFLFILASLKKNTVAGEKGEGGEGKEMEDAWFPGVRLVFDQTDHVFVEVWLTDLEDSDSERITIGSKGRWVHADPCEELLDLPLVYELGWKKELSYMFALSVPPPMDNASLRHQAVDVTDVVWKYTTDFPGVIRRRSSVSEVVLAQYLAQVHHESAQVIPGRLKPPFGLKVAVQELAIMCKPPKSSRDSLQGRKSGAESWRRTRGEISDSQDAWQGSNYLIKPTPSELKQKCIYLRYSSSLDAYARPYHKEVESNEEEVPSRAPNYLTEIFSQGWQSMAMRYKNIFRKVEKDWKMVYIARKQGSESYKEGVIEWVIDLTGTDCCVKDVTLFATMAVFEDRSKVAIEVTDDKEKSKKLTPGSPPLASCPDFAGAKTIRLSARLYNESDNDDPLVWQKAQLFRQKSTDHETWPLEFRVTLKRKEKSDI
ncbi:unnamed protein product [Hymenolepis diminuta]|uniref:Peptide-N(4)-(N-acetyl-beta-glucosaminyl)asparagine amidase n=2 Tax=Hymenolepis diminuta TaxID=6216 RepID=A0A0R3SEW6_HYMDI|nr:unnamed protein product [Hymenolepis diminuta]VUZ41838.1 unnamed protein product [Hymenolepis diminuta]